MTPLTLADPGFDRCVTLREAYKNMERFVAAYVARGDAPASALLAYLGIAADGGSGDAAALSDFLAVAERDEIGERAV